MTFTLNEKLCCVRTIEITWGGVGHQNIESVSVHLVTFTGFTKVLRSTQCTASRELIHGMHLGLCHI